MKPGVLTRTYCTSPAAMCFLAGHVPADLWAPACSFGRRARTRDAIGSVRYVFLDADDDADSEVLPLEWRQVDFGAGEVRLDPGKTKKRGGPHVPDDA